jgi:hypothetical protein
MKYTIPNSIKQIIPTVKIKVFLLVIADKPESILSGIAKPFF